MKHTTGGLPWTKSCFVCGEHNPCGFRQRLRCEDGCVVLDYATRETDVGYRHAVHGGILMMLLDEAMSWSAIIETGKLCVAAEVTARLKKPVQAGQRLRIEGWVAKNARRIILTEGRITDEAGDEVLAASGKFVPMANDQTKVDTSDFVRDPGTIPVEDILGSAG